MTQKERLLKQYSDWLQMRNTQAYLCHLSDGIGTPECYVQAEKIEVKTIDHIIEELIPPADYQHRNGFSNEHLVLNLTVQNKQEVEKRLIKMLETKDDELIGETLAILKSTDSLSSLNKRLNSAKSGTSKIIWASFINEIKTALYTKRFH